MLLRNPVLSWHPTTPSPPRQVRGKLCPLPRTRGEGWDEGSVSLSRSFSGKIETAFEGGKGFLQTIMIDHKGEGGQGRTETIDGDAGFGQRDHSQAECP